MRPASVPTEFSEVQSLSNEELVAVLTDDDKYRQLASAIAGQSRTNKVIPTTTKAIPNLILISWGISHADVDRQHALQHL